ncbi:MAG TPA: BMP family ABC transporter substrate-binding protein [Gaiellaceae bacterium]|nr:BMP family ABC transporter substrate-binding protein [Gaiellaceae bacterium]
MNKKRFAAGALAAVIVFAALATILVGSSSARPKAKQKQFTAALISDIGRFNDKSFNQFQLQGLNAITKKLKIKKIALQSDASSDYIPNMTTAIREGANIVMDAGYLMAGDLSTVAAQFPNTHFTITDDAVSGPANLDFVGKDVHNIEGLTYATNQNSYLIGCMAAMVTKAEKAPHQTIGVVGGIKIPPVTIFLAGYQAGARKCVPGTSVLMGYSGDFVKQDLCKNVAENQIQQGAHVIFAVAGGCGLGALSAAKDAGLWGVGVDQDQSFLGTYILTSAVKRVDIGIEKAVTQAKAGKFKGGTNLVFNLKNNGVALGKISPKLPKALKAAVLKKLAVLRKGIISGKIKVPTVPTG